MGIGLLAKRLSLIAEKGVEGQSNAVLLKCMIWQHLPPRLQVQRGVFESARSRGGIEEKFCSIAAMLRKKHFSASCYSRPQILLADELGHAG
jgi:hypothetical protein